MNGTRVVSIAGDGAAFAREALSECLTAGGVVVFPADGLYGLGCDPLREDAVERMHALKGRPQGKSSAVMYLAPLAMREVLSGLGPRALDAVSTLLPGPVTLVVANPEHRYPLACREDPDRLGLRLIEGPLAGVPVPMLQTSANASGEPPPPEFGRIAAPIIEGADLAIDGGTLTGRPSTVVDVAELDSAGRWAVLREGGISAGEVARRLGQ